MDGRMTVDQAMQRLLTPIGYAVRVQHMARPFPIIADWLMYTPRQKRIKLTIIPKVISSYVR